jgi:hypothetical protein
LNCRQQQADHDSNNCDDNQQLNKRKTFSSSRIPQQVMAPTSEKKRGLISEHFWQFIPEAA